MCFKDDSLFIVAVVKSCRKFFTFQTDMERNAGIKQSFYYTDAVGVSLPPHSGDLAPSREENAAVAWWRAS